MVPKRDSNTSDVPSEFTRRRILNIIGPMGRSPGSNDRATSAAQLRYGQPGVPLLPSFCASLAATQTLPSAFCKKIGISPGLTFGSLTPYHFALLYPEEQEELITLLARYFSRCASESMSVKISTKDLEALKRSSNLQFADKSILEACELLLSSSESSSVDISTLIEDPRFTLEDALQLTCYAEAIAIGTAEEPFSVASKPIIEAATTRAVSETDLGATVRSWISASALPHHVNADVVSRRMGLFGLESQSIEWTAKECGVSHTTVHNNVNAFRSALTEASASVAGLEIIETYIRDLTPWFGSIDFGSSRPPQQRSGSWSVPGLYALAELSGQSRFFRFVDIGKQSALCHSADVTWLQSLFDEIDSSISDNGACYVDDISFFSGDVDRIARCVSAHPDYAFLPGNRPLIWSPTRTRNPLLARFKKLVLLLGEVNQSDCLEGLQRSKVGQYRHYILDARLLDAFSDHDTELRAQRRNGTVVYSSQTSKSTLEHIDGAEKVIVEHLHIFGVTSARVLREVTESAGFKPQSFYSIKNYAPYLRCDKGGNIRLVKDLPDLNNPSK